MAIAAEFAELRVDANVRSLFIIACQENPYSILWFRFALGVMRKLAAQESFFHRCHRFCLNCGVNKHLLSDEQTTLDFKSQYPQLRARRCSGKSLHRKPPRTDIDIVNSRLTVLDGCDSVFDCRRPTMSAQISDAGPHRPGSSFKCGSSRETSSLGICRPPSSPSRPTK
jgi:hypothetical protein